MAVTTHHHTRNRAGLRPARTHRRPDVPPPPPPAPRSGHCRRCGSPVVACLDPAGTVVPVHPVAVVGGELVINGSQNQILLVLSEHEAAAAGRRNHLGYTVHARVCGHRPSPDA